MKMIVDCSRDARCVHRTYVRYFQRIFRISQNSIHLPTTTTYGVNKRNRRAQCARTELELCVVYGLYVCFDFIVCVIDLRSG